MQCSIPHIVRLDSKLALRRALSMLASVGFPGLLSLLANLEDSSDRLSGCSTIIK